MSNNTITESQINEYSIDLAKYVPKSISKDPITSKVFYSQGRQISTIKYYIQDLINQCFISTATWSLDIWEFEYGIKTDYTLSYENRRQTILAKKRGFGTVNEAKIKSIAEAYDCDCEVIPHWDEYYFIVKFTGLGVPSNLDVFKQIVEQIKPAHLNVEYEFTYEQWGEVNNFLFSDLTKYTWEQVLNQPLETSDNMMYSLNNNGTYNKITYEIEK
jgi:hypothetical protein